MAVERVGPVDQAKDVLGGDHVGAPDMLVASVEHDRGGHLPDLVDIARQRLGLAGGKAERRQVQFDVGDAHQSLEWDRQSREVS